MNFNSVLFGFNSFEELLVNNSVLLRAAWTHHDPLGKSVLNQLRYVLNWAAGRKWINAFDPFGRPPDMMHLNSCLVGRRVLPCRGC